MPNPFADLLNVPGVPAPDNAPGTPFKFNKHKAVPGVPGVPIEKHKLHPETLKNLKQQEIQAILAWLTQIGQTNQKTIAEVINRCEIDNNSRHQRFCAQARSIEPAVQPVLALEDCALHERRCLFEFKTDPGGALPADRRRGLRGVVPGDVDTKTVTA